MVPLGRKTDQRHSHDSKNTITVKQPALPLSQRDDCTTRKNTKNYTKEGPHSTHPIYNGSNNKQYYIGNTILNGLIPDHIQLFFVIHSSTCNTCTCRDILVKRYEHFSHYAFLCVLLILRNRLHLSNVFRRVKKVGIHSFNYRTLVYLAVNPVDRACPKTSLRSLIILQYNPDIEAV